MEKKRQPNFSADELEALTAGVEKRSKVLFGMLSGATTSATKQRAWEGITNEVNAVAGYGRTVGEIKRKWVCLKSETKGKMAAVKRERQKTGGGTNEEQEVSLMGSRIMGIMGEVCVVGIDGGIDTSKQVLQDLSG